MRSTTCTPRIVGVGQHQEDAMIKYVYAIDYPVGQKRAYLEWVRSIADILQGPDEIKRLASYDNYFSASPHRVVEFEFETMADAARYFERKEISRVLQGELPNHASGVQISVLKRLGDYTKVTSVETSEPYEGQ
jgi:hypothetical protein